MIIGIGTDIIEIDRIAEACKNENFKNKNFTKKELDLFACEKNVQAASMAGNFAAKEAVVKCLGTGFSGIKPIDIEILRDDFGKPFARLYKQALQQAENMEVSAMHISISHCRTFAVAYAIAEK